MPVLSLMLFVSFSLSGCNNSQIDNRIFQVWKHSYEEDTNGNHIYRPTSYSFPLGWSRKGLEFHKDGHVIVYEFASNDMSVEVAGRWAAINSNVMKITFENKDRVALKIDISDIDTNILKVKLWPVD